MCMGFFAGMTVRHFRGFSSIQEVECWGGNLDSDLKLMSLQMYKFSDSAVLASLNLYTKSCMTYSDFSSCVINPMDAHKSRLRLLVHDLLEGESRKYRCTVVGVKPTGITKTSTWSITVTHYSKWIPFLLTRQMIDLPLAVRVFRILFRAVELKLISVLVFIHAASHTY